VLRLVESRRDDEIIKHLRDMLKDAERGEVVGLLAAVHYGGSRYGYFGSGTMCNTPSNGLAAVFHLTTKLLTDN
jgi:hypothetical protein